MDSDGQGLNNTYTIGRMGEPESQHSADLNITDSGQDSSMGVKPLSERLLENRIFTLFPDISLRLLREMVSLQWRDQEVIALD